MGSVRPTKRKNDEEEDDYKGSIRETIIIILAFVMFFTLLVSVLWVALEGELTVGMFFEWNPPLSERE